MFAILLFAARQTAYRYLGIAASLLSVCLSVCLPAVCAVGHNGAVC